MLNGKGADGFNAEVRDIIAKAAHEALDKVVTVKLREQCERSIAVLNQTAAELNEQGDLLVKMRKHDAASGAYLLAARAHDESSIHSYVLEAMKDENETLFPSAMATALSLTHKEPLQELARLDELAMLAHCPLRHKEEPAEEAEAKAEQEAQQA